MNEAPYQLLPPLSPDDYAALKESIQREGVLIPIEVDESGTIIDGHHRVKICHELGIKDYPKTVVSGLDDFEKKSRARQLNIARRHLTTALKRILIQQQLEETPTVSSRGVSAILGVHHSTVEGVRRRLVIDGKVGAPSKRLGRNGKMQTAHRKAAIDEWRDLKLSNGDVVGSIPFYELAVRIRQAKADLHVLEVLHRHCVPDQNDSLVRDVLPHALVARAIQEAACDE